MIANVFLISLSGVCLFTIERWIRGKESFVAAHHVMLVLDPVTLGLSVFSVLSTCTMPGPVTLCCDGESRTTSHPGRHSCHCPTGMWQLLWTCDHSYFINYISIGTWKWANPEAHDIDKWWKLLSQLYILHICIDFVLIEVSEDCVNFRRACAGAPVTHPCVANQTSITLFGMAIITSS